MRVICCALLAGLSERMSGGALKSAVRFTGGLLLTLCLLSPFSRTAQLDLPDIQAYREQAGVLREEMEESAQERLRNGIAAYFEAYIEDKASSFGDSVRAEVTLQPRDGVPVPEGVLLWGAYSETLSAWLDEELAIPKEKQVWIPDD